MIRYHLTFVFSLVFSLSFSQNNAVVTGEIVNPTGDKVYLYNYTFETKRPKQNYFDSIKLDDNNRFKLYAQVDSITQVTFYDGNEVAQIYLGPGDSIDLKLNTLAFDETLDYEGAGSQRNNIVTKLTLLKEVQNRYVDRLVGEDEYDTAFVLNVQDSVNEVFFQLIKDYQKEVPDFRFPGNSLIRYREARTKRLRAYYKRKAEFEEKMAPLLGAKAIDFTGIDLKGKKTSLSDYKGKIIVVDFWATWCGPCKAEFPSYKELEEKYGNDVHFVSVGVYCKEDAWREMAKKEEFKNNIFLSEEDVKQIEDYMVKTIPRYLVINEDFELIDADAPRPSSGELQEYWVK